MANEPIDVEPGVGIGALRLGMTLDEAVTALGPPDRHDTRAAVTVIGWGDDLLTALLARPDRIGRLRVRRGRAPITCAGVAVGDGHPLDAARRVFGADGVRSTWQGDRAEAGSAPFGLSRFRGSSRPGSDSWTVADTWEASWPADRDAAVAADRETGHAAEPPSWRRPEPTGVDLPSEPELEAVVRAVDAVVGRDDAALAALGDRISGSDLYTWVDAEIVAPPGDPRGWVDGIRVVDGSLSVVVDLWSLEEGPSDLSLELGVVGDVATLEDLHVL